MNWFEKLFKKKAVAVIPDKLKVPIPYPQSRDNKEIKEEIERYNSISSTSYESNWVPPVTDDYSPPSYDFGSDSSSSSDSSSDFGGYDGGSFGGSGSSSDY